ncbi:MAG: hypothetical protein C0483_17655 [Pirellula sp.]|nr:hypothetical protein [Pirellula sp.]
MARRAFLCYTSSPHGINGIKRATICIAPATSFEMMSFMRRLLLELLPGLPRRLTLLGIAQLTATAAEMAFIGLTVRLIASLGSSAPSTGVFRAANLLGSAMSLTPASALSVAGLLLIVRLAAQSCGVGLWAYGVEAYERQHRGRLLASLLRAEWSRQSREPVGRMQQMLTHHAECISKAFTALAWSWIHVITAAVLLAGALYAQPWIAVGGAALLAGFQALLKPLAKRSRAAAALRAQALGRYVHLIGQSLGLLRELRVFNVAELLEVRAQASAAEVGVTRRVQNIIGSTLPALHQTAAGFLLVGGLGWAYADGAAGAAAVVSLALLLRAATAAQHLHSTLHQLQDVRPFLEEVVRSVAENDAAAAPCGGEPLPQIETIRLQGAAFAYDDAPTLLKDVHFSARRGEVVAVVGASGCGKSTLAHLLVRLLTPTSGRLLVNDRSAESFAAAAWYRRVAFLPQEPGLFHDTIAECVRFGRADITDAAVHRSIHAAGLQEDVAGMPAGLQTLVGERGTSLSFGQRQRVCLARALAGEPDLLVLDEPTAALDYESEERFVRTLENLRGEMLVVVVTHRPALLRVCDRVVEIENGRLSPAQSPRMGLALSSAAA